MAFIFVFIVAGFFPSKLLCLCFGSDLQVELMLLILKWSYNNLPNPVPVATGFTCDRLHIIVCKIISLYKLLISLCIWWLLPFVYIFLLSHSKLPVHGKLLQCAGQGVFIQAPVLSGVFRWLQGELKDTLIIELSACSSFTSIWKGLHLGVVSYFLFCLELLGVAFDNWMLDVKTAGGVCCFSKEL